MIIATAGHVDHGKTSLVKALTGVDTDTLAEEKARGLTINLGYAYLPTKNNQQIGFIDVPGHHRFINNMIAGASGIDRALLIVAADDGPMPQTREHLDVLTLLGVEQIDAVITKIDRCSSGQINAASSAVKKLICEATAIEPQIFPVSSTHMTGIEDLSAHLLNIAQHSSYQTDQHGFRLSIDRRFHIKGAGIVVTGTASAGQVSVGDTLTLLPQDLELRIREVRANDVKADNACAKQRVALCVSGKINLDDIHRGDALVDPHCASLTERIDVSISLLPHVSRPVKHLSPIKLHIGAKRVAGKIALINHSDSRLSPGDEAIAQLILEEPLSTTRGERFVIRDDSETHTLGGGFVLDPSGPKYGKSKPERLIWLDALRKDNLKAVVETLIQEDQCVDFTRLAACFNHKQPSPSSFTPDDCLTFQSGGKAWIVRKTKLAETRALLLSKVKEQLSEEQSEDGRSARGIVRDKLISLLRSRTHPALTEATLTALISKGELKSAEGRVQLPTNSNQSIQPNSSWLKLRSALAKSGSQVPVLSELQTTAGLSDMELKLAIKAGKESGELHRLNASRFALVETLWAFAKAAEELADEQSLTVVAFKNELHIGRKLAIEVLEFFDSFRYTRRVGDNREIANKAVLKTRFMD